MRQRPTSTASTTTERIFRLSSPGGAAFSSNNHGSSPPGTLSPQFFPSSSTPLRSSRRNYLIVALATTVFLWSAATVKTMYTVQTDTVGGRSLRETIQKDPTVPTRENLPNDDDDDNGADQDFSIVQFIITPYQQGQSYLPTLGHARMELFKTFTLPSMILNREDGISYNSPNGGFLWIIRTDPKLTKDLRDEMVELLKPYPNFFLITSTEKVNKLLNSWLNTSEIDEMVANPERILTGDSMIMGNTLRKIRGGYRDTHVTETRIDSDDGMNKKYLRSVRERIGKNFEAGQTSKRRGVDHNGEVLLPTWMFFCAASHVQWFPDEFSRSDYPSEKDAVLSRLGRLEGDGGDKGQSCVTPGLTIAIRAGTYGGINEGSPNVPVGLKDHQRLTHDLKKKTRIGTEEEKKAIGCGLKKPTECLVFLGKKSNINASDWFKYHGSFGIAVIRARALSSAGMKDIHTNTETTAEGKKYQDEEENDGNKKTTPDKASSKKKKQLWAHKDTVLVLNDQDKIIRNHLKKKKKFWDMLKSTFGVIPDKIAETRDLLRHNILSIAVDALRGQCSTGHSCKEEAKAKVAHVIAQLKENNIRNHLVETNKQGSSKNRAQISGEKVNDTMNNATIDKGQIYDNNVKGLVWRTDIGQKFKQKKMKTIKKKKR